MILVTRHLVETQLRLSQALSPFLRHVIWNQPKKYVNSIDFLIVKYWTCSCNWNAKWKYKMSRFNKFILMQTILLYIQVFWDQTVDSKLETPPWWAQSWAHDWAKSQVEPVCEMLWVWVHGLKIFTKFEPKVSDLSLRPDLSPFMKPAPDKARFLHKSKTYL